MKFRYNKLAVIALGGNALLRDDQTGTIDEQEKNATDTLSNLIYLIKEGYDIVITHGNGPQVGNILMRNDAGEQIYNIPQMPLDICVADSQGGIGYMIERVLRNILYKNNIEKDVVTIVTQVIVDKNDEAFDDPTKRIGVTYSAQEAGKLKKEKGWSFKETPKKKEGWRRVVPSPKPISIFNRNSIETIARQGAIVIAVGGGGIPVSIGKDKYLHPVEAVVDKDFTSALLASRINADEFYILTDVPYVYINYNQPDERKVEFLDKADTEKYLEEGMFGEGNMKPKIIAALYFIRHGGKKSVITEATKLEDRSYGTKITLNYEN
ncbi:MAG: carbamate kinase [Cytophagales bacterium]|nr:carbamate kinase [Cytophagales bacterium]